MSRPLSTSTATSFTLPMFAGPVPSVSEEPIVIPTPMWIASEGIAS